MKLLSTQERDTLQALLNTLEVRGVWTEKELDIIKAQVLQIITN